MSAASEFFKKYEEVKATNVQGRFFKYSDLQEALDDLKAEYAIAEIGRSFLNVPIQTIKMGKGSKKILAWSQMHGNETTTTKGILDLMHFFKVYKDTDEVQEMLRQCTLLIIPMLNPDGAARYTRENVNRVDLNRDACDLKEPESKVLRKCFTEFQPHFCFNLHDQRTIFGVGDQNLPATLSFLAPSMDEDRKVTPVRITAMKIISAMNSALQEVIPGQVGRFDDAFNINCTGDYFQSQEVPTILFECGHFQQDYMREKTRKFFAFAIFTALQAIASGSFERENEEDYFDIPENKKSFRDIILRNAQVEGKIVDVALQYSEKTKAGQVQFEPQIETIEAGLSLFGHYEIDCRKREVQKTDGTPPVENDIVEFILLNKEKFSIKSPDIP